ncbi:MAG: hypothetical protein JGK21_09310 [Microcoleus sp. PH2017_22_RUC_O_B]|uniref:hypothetical protein n=1 Tax=unclassified Microcoleus TaxID=2642155 RepID=UPI001DE0C9A8|nr:MULTISPECIES: hypothetical protein [unclassified Microcoleus]MCC3528395.1 hypothetical protein [Microcoleus sp. PH2017_21_RUC_O_A]MCC3540571.1 hypothetical protein [Microcoleus sp. PH2017_22_RUC_O_B]
MLLISRDAIALFLLGRSLLWKKIRRAIALFTQAIALRTTIAVFGIWCKGRFFILGDRSSEERKGDRSLCVVGRYLAKTAIILASPLQQNC